MDIVFALALTLVAYLWDNLGHIVGFILIWCAFVGLARMVGEHMDNTRRIREAVERLETREIDWSQPVE